MIYKTLKDWATRTSLKGHEHRVSSSWSTSVPYTRTMLCSIMSEVTVQTMT